MPLFLPHFNLQKFNTLAVPSLAQYFVSVKTDDELREALAFARTENLPLLLLGGGSNIVLRADFPGLVVQIKSQGREVVDENEEFVWLKVAAGENWHQLVVFSLDNALYGLENLSLIPGSVGAAPIQNIGAYGVEIKELVAELSALNIRSGLSVTFTNESCQFGYRDSIFKQSLKDQYVITSVTFRLRKQPHLNLTYPALRAALANTLEEDITPQQVSAAVIDIRQTKLPDPAVIPNVGSFFKNPVINQQQFDALKAENPTIVSYPAAANQVKLAAGWLIDQAGWKGREVGGAAVHEQQALVLTNPRKSSGQAVLALADLIKQSVFEQFGVMLEMEPRIYP
ncbi:MULTISPECIES: UDP-N-acetylmuramate dehydrogenase [Cellvibrio]|uniref:UDP-N-acetylenolpyruvoylglucosamine reductase n=1 Tax=Cellvibrio fibrivorans TaxID=126350 RepID=A0ABU1UX40_9GAMM|nr:UDP-N-acetylmuramate dehydrogenase [Cellvibrio fibrivorans]MDR7089692.1 UDP-N-acetylmuramate dehydrogenase [Cellvibrio fibrivorans]